MAGLVKRDRLYPRVFDAYDPFDWFDEMFRRFFRPTPLAFQPAVSSATRSITTYKDKDGVSHVDVVVPGAEPGKIDVAYEDGYLSIDVSSEHSEAQEGYASAFMTKVAASFYVGDIDKDSLDAAYEDGVLKVSYKELDEKSETIKVPVRVSGAPEGEGGEGEEKSS